MPIDVLYIHPGGHMNDLVVPAGAISCMNALDCSKLGRYAFEVTDEEIRKSHVVAIDLHWAISLPAFGHLVERVRSVHPGALIIVGGITAGHYGPDLFGEYPIDAAVAGDSETSFRALVDAYLSGRSFADIPNLVLPGPTVTPYRRMTREAFDQTDCISAEWFPTFDRSTHWSSRAFSHARTIPVARGCPLRCPSCYGSFASTFGSGFLWRSPKGLVRQVRRAEELGVRQLRLFMGKLPPRLLRDYTAALAEAGPMRFDDGIGVFLCSPPAIEDLDAFERAFENGIDISAVPPAEHVPTPGPVRLKSEMERWRAAAERVDGSHGLRMEFWTEDADAHEALLAAIPMVSERTGSKRSSPWDVFRPRDGQPLPPLDTLSDSMKPLWTFYAARLLSPALASMMAPLRDLDDIDIAPPAHPAPEGPLRGYWDEVVEQWDRVRLAIMPGLRFSAVPIATTGRLARPSGSSPLLAGRAGVARPVHVRSMSLDAPIALEPFIDEARVTLMGRGTLPDGFDGLAIVPHPPDGSPLDAGFLRRLSPSGLLTLTVPRDVGAFELDIRLLFQTATLVCTGADGQVVSAGRADLEFYRLSPPAPSGGPPKAARSNGEAPR
ncbi:MAG: hypothetical protein ACQEXJ_22045 [Myxococcota bacterium]